MTPEPGSFAASVPAVPQAEPLRVPAYARAPIPEAELASFKAIGVELCLDLDEAGPLWLVPRYTGQARKEITPEHAATLRLLLEAFPAARIGEVSAGPRGMVTLETRLGSRRLLDLLSGEQLPRIC